MNSCNSREAYSTSSAAKPNQMCNNGLDFNFFCIKESIFSGFLNGLKYLGVLICLCFLSCGKTKEISDNVLLKYGDRTLTLEEVVAQIPSGIYAADSVALFHEIVEGWIKQEVLSDFAEERLYDMNFIESKVRDYRNNLIVLEYLTRMRETQNPDIDEQKIIDYYNAHRKELKLELPLVKGVFLKINSSAPGKEDIKKLISSDNPEDFDRLENEWLDRALEYNYFRDKWIDWETISARIPYRFGDGDAFLKENQYFETEYGDCSYYLKITDVLPSGEEQPLEFAKTWIAELLTQKSLADYEETLVTSLVEKSLKDNKLEAVGYDPLAHRIK